MSVSLSVGGTQQLSYQLLGPLYGVGTPQWTSSDPSIASVNSVGTVTANASGTVLITATLNGISGTTTVTVTSSSTPQALVATLNAMHPALQVEHGIAAGVGHTLTSGRKLPTDFVALGKNGAVNSQASFGPDGLLYDPATPNKLAFSSQSIKFVAANDFDLSQSRWTCAVGLMNYDGIFNNYMQQHDGSGGHFLSHSNDSSTRFGIAWAGQATSTSGLIGRKKTGIVACVFTQYDFTFDEVQVVVDRDCRAWMSGLGFSSGFTGSRTIEIGNIFGGNGGSNSTGDLRLFLSGRGILSPAFINAIVDYSIANLGAVERTNPRVSVCTNSVPSSAIAAQVLQKTRTGLGDGYDVDDLTYPGATIATLQARSARLEQLMFGNSHRTKEILIPYEITNSLVDGISGATIYATFKTFVQTVLANAPNAKKIGVTNLPADVNAAHNSAAGLRIDTARQDSNTLLRADSYWTTRCDWAAGTPEGNYSDTTNTTDYDGSFPSGTHPTDTLGTKLAGELVPVIQAL